MWKVANCIILVMESKTKRSLDQVDGYLSKFTEFLTMQSEAGKFAYFIVETAT